MLEMLLVPKNRKNDPKKFFSHFWSNFDLDLGGAYDDFSKESQSKNKLLQNPWKPLKYGENT